MSQSEFHLNPEDRCTFLQNDGKHSSAWYHNPVNNIYHLQCHENPISLNEDNQMTLDFREFKSQSLFVLLITLH